MKISEETFFLFLAILQNVSFVHPLTNNIAPKNACSHALTGREGEKESERERE
jgi:hypothetical protein